MLQQKLVTDIYRNYKTTLHWGTKFCMYWHSLHPISFDPNLTWKWLIIKHFEESTVDIGKKYMKKSKFRYNIQKICTSNIHFLVTNASLVNYFVVKIINMSVDMFLLWWIIHIPIHPCLFLLWCYHTSMGCYLNKISQDCLRFRELEN